jgi:hypothetical protein
MKNDNMQPKLETSDEQESGSALRGAACSSCGGSGTRIIGEREGGNFWNRCIPCECRAETLVAKYRRALADAIRRPMGTIPDSADGLVDMDDLRAAELRRPKTPTLEKCCSNGWAINSETNADVEARPDGASKSTGGG